MRDRRFKRADPGVHGKGKKILRRRSHGRDMARARPKQLRPRIERLIGQHLSCAPIDPCASMRGRGAAREIYAERDNRRDRWRWMESPSTAPRTCRRSVGAPGTSCRQPPSNSPACSCIEVMTGAFAGGLHASYLSRLFRLRRASGITARGQYSHGPTSRRGSDTRRARCARRGTRFFRSGRGVPPGRQCRGARAQHRSVAISRATSDRDREALCRTRYAAQLYGIVAAQRPNSSKSRTSLWMTSPSSESLKFHLTRTNVLILTAGFMKALRLVPQALESSASAHFHKGNDRSPLWFGMAQSGPPLYAGTRIARSCARAMCTGFCSRDGPEARRASKYPWRSRAVTSIRASCRWRGDRRVAPWASCRPTVPVISPRLSVLTFVGCPRDQRIPKGLAHGI